MNLILAGICVIAIGLALAALVAARRCQAQNQVQATQMQEALQATSEKLQKAARATAQLQRQLQQLQKSTADTDRRIRQTASRQQELESRDFSNITYLHASKLVKMGADSDDLVSSCGLSPAEARLLAMMHKEQSTVA